MFSFRFDLLCSLNRYSLTRRFQKWFTICCTFRHVLKLAGIWVSNFPGGRDLNGRLIRKWLGVRGISLSGISETIVRGLEFKMASLSTSIVCKTSSESRFEPRMISSVLFAVCIKLSICFSLSVCNWIFTKAHKDSKQATKQVRTC